MVDEALPPSLQESLLALLAFNDTHGAEVAVQVKPEHFDAPYQEIATKLLSYRRENGRSPGYAHLDDLFGWALEKGDKAPRLRRLLVGITDLGKGLNAGYVAARVQDFIRRQSLKSAIMRAGELYAQGGDDHILQVEQVLYAALRAKFQGVDPGTWLGDTKRSLNFFEHKGVDYPLGINELDRLNIGATAKELLLYIAPKGSGKSWFAVHMGRQGLIHRGRVLHVTLEMSEEKVAARYYQNLFGAAWTKLPYTRTTFEYDELQRLVDIKTTRQRPKLAFSDPNARKLLRAKLQPWGRRLGTILIKEFPTGSLSVPQLSAYLDYLESAQKFIPTMLIIDYPKLMRLDRGNMRLDLGRTFEELRGLGSARNMAIIAPHQGNRSSMTAKRVRSADAGEDISVVQTADTVLTYSKTETEKRHNLARLLVAHSRGTDADQELVISQAYAIGQYVLESAMLSSEYWERMKLANDDGSED